MIDFIDVNAAVLSDFAEPVLFALPVGSVFLPAIYDTEQDIDRVADLPVNGDVKTLSMLQSDVDAHSIQIRETVTVRGINYQILDIAHDAAGFSTLQIRRYS